VTVALPMLVVPYLNRTVPVAPTGALVSGVDCGVACCLGTLGWIRNDFLYLQGSVFGSAWQATVASCWKHHL